MRFVRASIVLALATAYLAYVFQISGGRLPDSGLGDWLDPYFINFLLEHWRHAAWNLSDPASPPMYFPVRGTLGYSHGLILYAPFYMAVRPFLDPFQAFSLALLLMIETGSICLYLILRRCLSLGFVESVLLSAFFLTSPNVINQGTAAWSQTASVFLIPPILLIGLVPVRMREGWPRLVLAWLSGCLAALVFTQDFYTGMFALLAATLLVIGVLLFAQARLRTAVTEVWRAGTSAATNSGAPLTAAPRPSLWWLVVACLCLAWAAVVLIHPVDRITIGGWRVSARNPTRLLPLAYLTGGWFVVRRFDLVRRLLRAGRRFSRMVVALVGVVDLRLAASERAASFRKRYAPLFWAWALGGFIGSLVFLWIYLGVYLEHPAFPEDQLLHSLRTLDPSRWHGSLDAFRDLAVYQSVRPFTLVFTVGILAWVPWLRINGHVKQYGLWFLLISLIVFLIPLRFGEFSIWQAFFAPIPGLSVLRDPKRIIYTYELAVALITGLFLSQLPRRSPSRTFVAVLLLVLLFTDWNNRVFPLERPRGYFRQWVEAPIDIDASCRSFFIQGASDRYMSRAGHMWSLYAVDAAFISLNHSLPTLNGYSAWAPDGWQLANPQEPEYLSSVRRWIERYDLRGVCALDIDARTMRPFR